MRPEEEHQDAVRRLNEAQARLGALEKGDPARDGLKREIDELVARMRRLKELIKAETTKRAFAGLGNSPLFLACVERFDAATMADLEARALEIQTEREEAAAARRASKAAAAPAVTAAAAPLPSPKGSAASERRTPEVVVLRRANGGGRP